MTATLESKTNHEIACSVLEQVAKYGCQHFCLCPGGRNAPFIQLLSILTEPSVYPFFDERSAAFFAIGLIKKIKRPVAIITTSGTAVGELLPAAMETYYSALPIILITADRPKRFRGSGAPQSAEQLKIFGVYTPSSYDLDNFDEFLNISWEQDAPLHLNVCFEEPEPFQAVTFHPIKSNITVERSQFCQPGTAEALDSFLSVVRNPLVVLGGISEESREEILAFCLRLNAPVVAEAHSGLREEKRLYPQLIQAYDQLWKLSDLGKYPIDGILRIGSVPTARLWRDLETKKKQIELLSISEQPFSGSSRCDVFVVRPLADFFKKLAHTRQYNYETFKEADEKCYSNISMKHEEHLIHQLSKIIPEDARIYLGNSLPIRNWDQYASYDVMHADIHASRGLNGIDGQLSTFFGLAVENKENWAIVGDLTALYDLSSPWILRYLENLTIRIVIVNNGGGQIFSKMFTEKLFINQHDITFKPFAELWKMDYQLWHEIPSKPKLEKKQLIELGVNESWIHGHPIFKRKDAEVQSRKDTLRKNNMIGKIAFGGRINE